MQINVCPWPLTYDLDLIVRIQDIADNLIAFLSVWQDLMISILVLVAELIAVFRPKIVEIHNYNMANSATNKLANWGILNRSFLRTWSWDCVAEFMQFFFGLFQNCNHRLLCVLFIFKAQWIRMNTSSRVRHYWVSGFPRHPKTLSETQFFL